MPRFIAYGFSICIAIVALWLFSQYRDIAQSHVTAEAKALNLEVRSAKGPGNSVRRTYHPIVRFTLEDGTETTVTLANGRASRKLPAADATMTVIYPIGQPEQAQEPTGLALLWPGLLAAALAIASAIAGVILSREEKQPVAQAHADRTQ